MFPAQRQSQSFNFPYRVIKTEFGAIPYPILPVTITSGKKSLKYDFVVDTGADVTTMPKHMAYELGIDLSNLAKGKSQGVGEGLVETWETKVRMQIANERVLVRCSFVSSNKIPPLLGKVDIFSRFNFYFDNDNGQLVLTTRKR